ncbi:GNAT family N-acetyltransferase [Microbacterium fluvii]|uniref:GNAT family N-acetyltransferase n=1 Tax=Microbacterium fluvii TaxID=415215 RepID=A0ABW2H9N1_9MICO|nr:GNAT family N-acetyltransferase [Microbacterium fluvii]MCU4671366.1 GNAT family N-acetyltransferase [Microbacterium fluvii]
MRPVVLRTARLELSVPTDADVEAIYAACQDADIQRYTTVPSPYERRHAEEFVPKVAREWDEAVHLTWAMREQGVLVGMIGLYRLSGSGDGEIGYWMAAEARGRGLLTEAARAVVDWGFSPEGADLVRIEWHAVAGNVASAKVARALGFAFEGYRRQALVSPTGRDDGWAAALLRDDDRTPQPWAVLGDPIAAVAG